MIAEFVSPPKMKLDQLSVPTRFFLHQEMICPPAQGRGAVRHVLSCWVIKGSVIVCGFKQSNLYVAEGCPAFNVKHHIEPF